MATDNNNKVLNVPNLRFPGFGGEWEREKLRDKCSFYSGGTPSSSNKSYYIGEIPFIRSGEISGDSTELFLSEFGLNNSSAKMVDIGDLLLALYGATSGQIAISKIRGAINQAILCIKSSYDNIFLKSVWEKHVDKILQAYLQGGQGNLSADIVKNLSFYFPSLDEQNKISKLIVLIDERIETQNKIIEDLKKLKVAITQKISKDNSNRKVMLSELLTERYEKNKDLYPVHSVSVSEGIINQVDFLGRSFAANDISNYNVVCCGDIVYTKSPTGDFPYGIVKMSSIDTKVSVSPLYGVYHPSSEYVGIYLHNYFSNSLNAKNYLHKLIQKGAKNTINITNKRFLKNEISLPNETLLKEYSLFISAFDLKIKSEQKALLLLQKQKEYLLQQMFI